MDDVEVRLEGEIYLDKGIPPNLTSFRGPDEEKGVCAFLLQEGGHDWIAPSLLEYASHRLSPKGSRVLRDLTRTIASIKSYHQTHHEAVRRHEINDRRKKLRNE